MKSRTAKYVGSTAAAVRRVPRPLLSLSLEAEGKLIAAARDSEPVQGLTHGFYKYPARFSPTFARRVIMTFTQPGELVLDNHVGGGTTLVEALALGRNAVGVDISALAEFVATVKTTLYDERELRTLSGWIEELPETVHVLKNSRRFKSYDDRGYYKHLDHPLRWRIRKAIEQAVWSAIRLRSKKLESFGRCAVLRTAQWALDGRKKLPSISEFRETLVTTAEGMITGAREFAAAVNQHAVPPSVRILKRSAAGLEDDDCLNGPRPKLVITSPPYPGVHVLYHRWQVDGRKEAPVPFMIANRLDGAGSSYYTMGDRKVAGLKTYFDNIQATMSSVATIADDRTVVIQMVAFSEPSWQLERYLEAMEAAGLSEIFLSSLRGSHDGRLWRTVPSRRWYSDQRGATPASQEVVLFHRKAN